MMEGERGRERCGEDREETGVISLCAGVGARRAHTLLAFSACAWPRAIVPASVAEQYVKLHDWVVSALDDHKVRRLCAGEPLESAC